ncbi:MAG: 6-bladed beta-propeller [Acidobacteria bacterium]|nr:6-bladed beta-propeller [Acidobacteriota bacterium]
MQSGFLRITIFYLLFCLSFYACNQTEWKGTIEVKDGVTFVKNPREPLYAEMKLNLEEELSIKGISENGDFIFAEVSSIAVDRNENIFICDRKEANIKLFDRSGNFLATIGRRGQGPGEMSDPERVCISNNDELVVLDVQNRCFLYFSLDGKYIKTLKSRGMLLLGLHVDSKGNILASTLKQGQSFPEYELIKYDPDLNPQFTIGSMPYQQNMRAINPFAPGYTYAVDQNDNIVYGYSDKYEIQIFSPQGKSLKIITKEYDAVRITDAEKEEEKSKAPPYAGFNFPDTHSAFQSIKLDDEGRIFVKTWKKEYPGKGFYYDIFDSQGRYTAEIFLEAMPSLFKNQKLYAIEEEEDGFQVVKRYGFSTHY